MTHTFKSLALAVAGAALFAIGGSAAADATGTNQAVLTVNATVTNNCDVTQPTTLTFNYNPVANTTSQGTSSFTVDCTNGSTAQFTVTGSNSPSGNDFDAVLSTNGLRYFLYENLTCASSNQLTSGTTYLINGSGTYTTAYLCAQADTSFAGNQTLPVGTYVDTVTFAFNFAP